MTATELLEDFTRRFGGEPDTAEIYFAGAGLDMLGGVCASSGGNVLTASLSPGTYAVVRHTNNGKISVEESTSNIELTCDAAALGIYQEKNRAAPVFQSLAALQTAERELAGAEFLLHHSIQNAQFQQAAAASVLAADRLKSQPEELARFCIPHCAASNSAILSGFAGKNGALLLSAPKELQYSYLPFPAAEYKIILTMTEEKNKKDLSGLFTEAFHTMRDKNPSLTSAAQLTESDAELCRETLLYPYAKFMLHEQQRIASAAELLRQRQPDLNGFWDVLGASGRAICGLYRKIAKDAVSFYELACRAKLCAACRILDNGCGVFSIVRGDQVDTFLDKLRTAFVEKAGYPPVFYVCSTADSGVQIPPPPKPPA